MRRETWSETLRAALISGTGASVFSTLALMLLGRRELGDAAAPVNAPSQWIWGRHATLRNGFSWKYTLVGYVTQHGASIFWALLFERVRARLARPGTPVAALGAGAATSAAAA